MKERLVNEAAILAARRNKKQISMLEFQEAIEKVIAGPERKSRIIPEKERNIIAHHEAGHALQHADVPYKRERRSGLRCKISRCFYGGRRPHAGRS
jgi:cell division protease FtsH